MADKTNQNSPNSGEGKDEYKEFIKKLETAGRVELSSLNEELLRRYGTLNIALFKGKDTTRIRSGGFEIEIRGNIVNVYKEEKIQVNGKVIFVKGKEQHSYVSNCLAKNIEALLSKLLTEYGYKLENNGWASIKLPRSNVEVRKLQSWLLATIYGFNKPLRDSPLICPSP
jgi:hypothetical protein